MAGLGTEFEHNESLLDLLMRQQTRGEHGVRLSFHPELLSALALSTSPYHFCAVTGNTELACFLYNREVGLCRSITVASFSAAGANGSTPWRKAISVSASDAALLAGHSRTAHALSLAERGVPLHWSEEQHYKFPKDFRDKARTTISMLLGCQWFIELPGPARKAIVNVLMQRLTRTMVWGFVNPSVFEKCWEDVLGPELHEAASNVAQKMDYVPMSTTIQPSPQYQFRVAQAHQHRGRKRWRLLGCALRGVMGTLWWAVHSRFGGNVPQHLAVPLFMVSGSPFAQVALPFLLAILNGKGPSVS